MSIRLLHIADVHIGVENYGQVDRSGIHTRLQDFVKCFKFAIETALQEGVHLAIFAGDAYKSPHPNPTHQREFATQIRLLSEKGIPVVMIVGNHDLPVGFGKASSVEIFDTLNTPNVYIVEEPKILRIKTKEGEVQIACIPWTTRALFLGRECRALSDDEANEKIRKVCSELIKNFTNKLDPSIPSVLACHLAVSEAVYSGGERLAMIGKEPTIPKEVLARSAFDYVCLGHIHKHQNLNPDSHPPIVYCGSIERVDFGEEKEEKGFCIVTLNGKDTSYKFIKTPARPFHTINVSTEGGNPTECIIRELKKHDLAGAIVKIFYTTSNEGDSINHTEIKLALKDAFLLAGIFRKTHVERKRRPHISEDLRMIDALDRYIKANPSLNRIERELKATALALERELEAKDDSS